MQSHPRTIETSSYGAEVEKVFSDADGQPHAVDTSYFQRLSEIARHRGDDPKLESVSNQVIGVTNSLGCETLDNSFILGESSVWPAISEDEGGLSTLNEVLNHQLRDVQVALSGSGGFVLNFSNHPLVTIDEATYQRYVAPKPVYDFLRNVRGWDHKSGIDAKAQNSPSIGVSAENAVEALNISMAISAAAIALFANSPFEQGRLSTHQESRLKLWDEIFKKSPWSGDQRTTQMPDRPFHSLKDYFTWMFDDDTSMYFVVKDKGIPSKDEKGNVALLRIEGDPSLLRFMQGGEWKGLEYNTSEHHTIIPEMSHFEAMQFTQFSGARIRYKFKDEIPEVEEFREALQGPDSQVDEFFTRHAKYIYIEEREPGANFPDREIFDTMGLVPAMSVVISPAALYVGAIRNAASAKELINKYGWSELKELRDAAIINGLEATGAGIAVKQLCDDVLEVAHNGLRQEEQWMLSYPDSVLRTGKNGAQRAINRYEELTATPPERIAQIATERALVLI